MSARHYVVVQVVDDHEDDHEIQGVFVEMEEAKQLIRDLVVEGVGMLQDFDIECWAGRRFNGIYDAAGDLMMTAKGEETWQSKGKT